MMKMFSIAYDQRPYRLPAGWIEPFAVGPLARSDLHGGYADRGQGDSIADLNQSFGELTAHYWIWKNLPPVAQIGFCHYRRYFNFLPLEPSNAPKLLADPQPVVMQFLADPAQAERALTLLKTSDVIATRQYCLPQSIAQQFCSGHAPEIWMHFLEAVRALGPNWLCAYLPWLDSAQEFRFYPVFIMPWALFDELCSLMFPILFRVCDQVGPLSEAPGQRFAANRYPAYLAERFMMLYFHARGLRIHGAQLVALEAGA